MMKKILFFMAMSFILLCGVNAQTLIQQANSTSIVSNHLHPTTAHSLNATAQADQTRARYNPDTWENTYIHKGDTVTQGIGGTSCYYSVPHALRTVGYDSIRYWQSLQVRRHPTYGYRKKVQLYIVNTDSIPAAVGKVLANINDPSGQPLGTGGAWQFFIEATHTNKLRPIVPPVDLTRHP